ncbi:hypothetical protein DNX69_06285 [Rhodopseudomonas palustris]|uniref:Uncharacterized protein n=1 Tax=Rhodopseudomonas palustris TaxID=1076 RepID=A0A323UYC4_RHOPL|nr:hypothetical protein DNX69_06285 [Rhodopseudomonas palustris]
MSARAALSLMESRARLWRFTTGRTAGTEARNAVSNHAPQAMRLLFLRDVRFAGLLEDQDPVLFSGRAKSASINESL